MEDVERAMIDVVMKHPSMRLELCEYLNFLKDEEFQSRRWINQQIKHGDPSLSMVYNFFFDDTRLFDDPAFCIGWFLKDESEAHAIRPLTAAMDAVAESYGVIREAECVAAPEWRDVVAAARAAHALICGCGAVEG